MDIDATTLTRWIEEYAVPTGLTLILFVVGWIVAGIVGRMAGKAMRRARLDETLSRFFEKLIRWGVLLLVVLACLGRFGVETTSFAAVIGAAGLAVGLAFQGTLANFSAGVMLLVFRPFKVGDVISVGGSMGKVDGIELFTTVLDTPDNRRLIVPNSAVFGSSIENLTHHPIRRIDVSVGVAYDADLDATRAALQKAIDAAQPKLSEPAPQIVLTGLGASSVDYVVRVWGNSADFWALKETLTGEVKRALDAADIGIPFPQLEVHMQK